MNLPLRPRAKCDKQTVGLLLRRHIKIDQIKYIGKESNNLEEVEAGLEHSKQNIYTEYPDPRTRADETDRTGIAAYCSCSRCSAVLA